jgi:sodium-dependent dicarboxylate transporter 2/3/5
MTEGESPGTGVLARVGFWAGPALFLAAWLSPLPALSFQGTPVPATPAVHVVLGLTLWMATWWLTEALPLAATALLPLVVLPSFGVMTAKAVAPAYFDDTIALFLGGFCLALGMEKSGLHRRFAWLVVRVAGTGPRGLVFGFFAASGLVSMWVSNTATALMLMPVAVNVVRAVLPASPAGPSRGASNFAACCVLAVAYGASLGGVGTLIGTPPNMFFRRHVDSLVAGGADLPEVTFGRWIVVGAPIVLVTIPAAWFLLTRFVLPVPKAIDGTHREGLLDRLRPAGRATFAERAVFVVFVSTAALWITREPVEIGGFDVPLTGWARAFTRGTGATAVSFVTDGTIAVAAALALFTLPSRAGRGDRLLTWDFALARLPWGALLLFGGGLCLAEAFKVPGGLNGYLMALFAGLGGIPDWLVLVVVAFGLTALSEVTSNTAAISMMLPVLTSLAEGVGAPVLPILLAGTLAASCGFALPIATMPNTIAYGTGLASVRQMGRAGLVLDVFATLVMVAAVLVLVPLAFG